MKSLSSALSMGALASVTYLRLDENRIGDDGLTSLSSALATGAMASLRMIFLDSPSEQLKDHCSSKGIKLNTF